MPRKIYGKNSTLIKIETYQSDLNNADKLGKIKLRKGYQKYPYYEYHAEIQQQLRTYNSSFKQNNN